MEISARSYLTAGVAFTAASAIALTPLAIPTEGRTIALPNVSTADVQLSAVINPAAVDALITALRNGLAEVTVGIDNLTAQTAIGLNNVLTRTQALNTGLWNRLIEAAGPGALGALVTALGSYSEASLALTASSIEGAAGSLLVLPGDITDIIGSTLIGSLNTALYAMTDVINNPLRLASYTGLLAGVVNIVGDILVSQDPNYSTGLLPGPGGPGLVNTVLGSTLGAIINVVGFGTSGLTGQINLAVDSLSNALDNLAQQSGSGLVTGLVGLIQGLALNPIQIINNTAVVGGLGNIGLPVFLAVGPILESASDAVVGVQNGLNIALNAIGNDPLDLESYTTALGGLFNGGFDVTSAAITAGTSVAALPVNVLAGVTNTTAALITALTTNLTQVVAGLLTQVGLDAAAEMALSLGVQVNEAVNGVAGFVAGDVLGGIAGLIGDANDNLQALNNDARNAINNLLGYTPPVTLQRVQIEAVDEGPDDVVSDDGELATATADVTLVSDNSAPDSEATAPAVSDDELAVSDDEDGDGSLDDAAGDAGDDGSLDDAVDDEDVAGSVNDGSLDDDETNDAGNEGAGDNDSSGSSGTGGSSGAGGSNEAGGSNDAGGDSGGGDSNGGDSGGGDSGGGSDSGND